MTTKPIRSFRDLDAWQSAMSVAVLAHKIAEKFPATQTFALGAQIRRAATSIPSNVAEGHARRGLRNYLNYVRIALGSRAELDTQLELALRLKLMERREFDDIASEMERCGQLLHGLERALVTRSLGTATAIVALSFVLAWII